MIKSASVMLQQNGFAPRAPYFASRRLARIFSYYIALYKSTVTVHARTEFGIDGINELGGHT